MKNDFLKFYGEKQISPVHQDIDDFELHLTRRKKLYRQCGVPVLAFRNAKILEIGPGSGYNTLAFFEWNLTDNLCVGGVDLVEANKTGIADMKNLFASRGIEESRYNIFEGTIEKFDSEKKFDIIIAEGFLHFLDNQAEIIEKIKYLSAKDCIVVVTCIDEVGLFIEVIKRLIGQILVSNISDYQMKVEKLVEFFEPQLKTLRGVSRPVKDWVEDQLLNPATVNGVEFTLIDAIKMFGDDYDVLGSSPNMFTDYSWYKDVNFDYKKDYEKQYNEKILSFFLAGSSEIKCSEKFGAEIHQFCKESRNLIRRFEETGNIKFVEQILEICKKINSKIKNFDDKLSTIFDELQNAVGELLAEDEFNFEKYPEFFSAFGRTQHYIAFQKKF